MPTVKIINDDASIASSSTASDIPRRRRTVRKRDIRRQPHDRDRDKEMRTRPLYHQRTVDNIATWVSRRVSVRSLTARRPYRDTDTESFYSAPYADTDDEGLADSYAAFCRAFTAGRSEYNYHGYTHEHEYEHEHRSHSGSYRERRCRVHPADCESLREDEERPDEKGVGSFRIQHDRALDAAMLSTERPSPSNSVGRHSPVPLAVRASDEDHDPHLALFSPLGTDDCASLPAPPISPPPRILTPAIYAENQRAAAQEQQWAHSQEGRQMGKDTQWGGRWKGFRGWWRGKRIACW